MKLYIRLTHCCFLTTAYSLPKDLCKTIPILSEVLRVTKFILQNFHPKYQEGFYEIRAFCTS